MYGASINSQNNLNNIFSQNSNRKYIVSKTIIVKLLLLISTTEQINVKKIQYRY